MRCTLRAVAADKIGHKSHLRRHSSRDAHLCRSVWSLLCRGTRPLHAIFLPPSFWCPDVMQPGFDGSFGCVRTGTQHAGTAMKIPSTIKSRAMTVEPRAAHATLWRRSESGYDATDLGMRLATVNATHLKEGRGAPGHARTRRSHLGAPRLQLHPPAQLLAHPLSFRPVGCVSPTGMRAPSPVFFFRVQL